jgi:hypothetical protein
MPKAKEIIKDNYKVQVNYSKESIKNKLLKFIPKKGDPFEISAEELSSMLIGGVNRNTLEATFVETDRVDVVEVGRQLECVLDKNMKKGEKIRLNYAHPYPLSFALIEQVYGIAKIKMDVPMLTLTKEYIEETKKKLKPEQEEFIGKFYKSFKNVDLNKK